jgi:hypothetical protein
LGECTMRAILCVVAPQPLGRRRPRDVENRGGLAAWRSDSPESLISWRIFGVVLA